MPQGQLGRVLRAMREHKPHAPAAGRKAHRDIMHARCATVDHAVGWHVTD